jgi:hypothetical protein
VTDQLWKALSLDLETGRLTLWVNDEQHRAVCEHVRDGEPAVQPTGTMRGHDGEVWSWELCRVCSAFHTLTPEQREEQSARNLLHLIEHVDELPDE